MFRVLLGLLAVFGFAAMPAGAQQQPPRQQEVKIQCVESAMQGPTADKNAAIAGTIVGLIAGAAESGGDVAVTIFSGGIGCEVGKLFGQAWQKTRDTSIVIAKGVGYQIQKNTPTQAIIQYIGLTKDSQPKPKEDSVLSLDVAQNAIVIPLHAAALKKLGVSDRDSKNILVLTTPLDPSNFKQKKDTINKILKTKF